jgi:hypothetical protein
VSIPQITDAHLAGLLAAARAGDDVAFEELVGPHLPIHTAAVLLGKITFEAVRAAITATAVLILALSLGADNAGGIGAPSC